MAVIIASSGISTSYAESIEICPRATTERGMFNGSDGWIYQQNEMRTNSIRISDESLLWLKHLVQAFAAKGTHVYLSAIPNRAAETSIFLKPVSSSIAQTLKSSKEFVVLPENYSQPNADKVYQDFLQRLSTTGLKAVDLSTALRYPSALNPQPTFFKKDPHWTSEGALQAAMTVAKLIKTDPLYSKAMKTPSTLKMVGTVAWNSSLSQLVSSACEVKAAQETKTIYELHTDMGLLDETEPEVAVVGSSMTRNFFYGPAIQDATQLLTETVAVDGGNVFGGLEQYLLDGNFQSHPPKFLIWEWPLMTLWELSDISRYRQIIPLIITSKKDIVLASAVGNFSSGETFSLSTSSTDAAYLRIEVSSLELKKFMIQIECRDGKTDNVVISRSDRLKNNGIFHLLLGCSAKSVNVQSASESKGNYKVEMFKSSESVSFVDNQP